MQIQTHTHTQNFEFVSAIKPATRRTSSSGTKTHQFSNRRYCFRGFWRRNSIIHQRILHFIWWINRSRREIWKTHRMKDYRQGINACLLVSCSQRETERKQMPTTHRKLLSVDALLPTSLEYFKLTDLFIEFSNVFGKQFLPNRHESKFC
jgi:hypothetical protein